MKFDGKFYFLENIRCLGGAKKHNKSCQKLVEVGEMKCQSTFLEESLAWWVFLHLH